jgi:hypothetical protein
VIHVVMINLMTRRLTGESTPDLARNLSHQARAETPSQNPLSDSMLGEAAQQH